MAFLVAWNRISSEFLHRKAIRNILYATAKVSVRLGVTMETRDKDSTKFLVISCLLCLFFHQNKLPEPRSEPHNTQLCCQRHTGLLPCVYLTKKRGAWLLTHSSSMNESPVSRREVLSLPWVTHPEHSPASKRRCPSAWLRSTPVNQPRRRSQGMKAMVGGINPSFSRGGPQHHLSLAQNKESWAFEFTEPDLCF